MFVKSVAGVSAPKPNAKGVPSADGEGERQQPKLGELHVAKTEGDKVVLSLRDIQEEQKSWVRHNFGKRRTWFPFIGAVEELGELGHHYLKGLCGIRGAKQEHIEKEKDAIGDIILFLADYCTARGFDLQDCVEETWKEVRGEGLDSYPLTGRAPL